MAVVDTQGHVEAEFRIGHGAAGRAEFLRKVAGYPARGAVLETPTC